MAVSLFYYFFITLGLELSDTKVHEPSIRALLGTASHYCEALVLKLGLATADWTPTGHNDGRIMMVKGLVKKADPDHVPSLVKRGALQIWGTGVLQARSFYKGDSHPHTRTGV